MCDCVNFQYTKIHIVIAVNCQVTFPSLAANTRKSMSAGASTLSPRPHWGSLQRCCASKTPSWFQGAVSRQEGMEGMLGRTGEGKGMGGGVKGRGVEEGKGKGRKKVRVRGRGGSY